jgi:periplasmic protein CpxP/Spy
MHTQQSRRFSPTLLTLSVLVVAVSSSLALSAWAMPGHGHGGHYGGHLSGHHGGHHGGDAALHGRMLDRINATPEQRAQITRITEAGRADMTAQRDAAKALRTQMQQAMSATVVDANAVEALRQQGMALHDQASRRRTQMMVDISRVLTPQQRQQIAERMARHGDMRQRHRQEREQLDAQPAIR